MSDKIINVTFPKCGTCVYWQTPDARGLAECHGMPPTVMMIGASQDQLGRPALQFEVFSPKVQRTRSACSLYNPRDDFATAGSS